MGRATTGLVMALTLMLASTVAQAQEDLAAALQAVSVTVKADRACGSGVLISRQIGDEHVSFVLTAAHVVDRLRSERRTVVGGRQAILVEYRDATILYELIERGRKVGEVRLLARMIRYSDADHGEDLALLMVRKRGLSKRTAVFTEGFVPESLGTRLYHVGSMLGVGGANSMTSGIVSFTGRVVQLSNGSGTVFDQVTCPAFNGSSGGGVFIADGPRAGALMGLVVRGAGETFVLVVPTRRIRAWTRRVGVPWVMGDEEVPACLEDVLAGSVEEQP
jgi:S1-C subfamily serine protease